MCVLGAHVGAEKKKEKQSLKKWTSEAGKSLSEAVKRGKRREGKGRVEVVGGTARSRLSHSVPVSSLNETRPFSITSPICFHLQETERPPTLSPNPTPCSQSTPPHPHPHRQTPTPTPGPLTEAGLQNTRLASLELLRHSRGRAP